MRGALKDLETASGGGYDFDAIVSQHADAVYRITARHLGAGEAEDATQEVFLLVHRDLHRFRGQSALRTWIYRIATNVSLKRIRRRGRRPFLERLGVREPAADVPAPDAEAGREEKRAALRAALERLPEAQRAVVVLRMQGVPFAEVARTLGIRQPTAESRMARAKAKLRDLLAEWMEVSQ
jgi:RNA polymerase sigma-70 factor (ECF subfamily)